MNVIRRAFGLLKRRENAKRIGIGFSRARSFRLPQTIASDGRTIAIDLPEEAGQRTAFIEIMLDDCYRLHDIARKSDAATILDIGANVGIFSVAARAAFPGARIHAYEPNAALVGHLSNHAQQAGSIFSSRPSVTRKVLFRSLWTRSNRSCLRHDAMLAGRSARSR
jgi:hypothetical protein